MKKSLLCFLLFVLLASTVTATDSMPWSTATRTPTNIHWMPDYNAHYCMAPVHRYTEKTVPGVLGKKSDGTTICFVPRRR